MNPIVVFVSLALVLSVSHGKPMTKDEMKAAARQMMADCKGKVGASDADVEKVKQHQMPETREGLCMLECIFDTSKIMKDGKYSKEGFIAAFSPHVAGDETKLTGVRNLGETCEKELGEGGSDKCENAKVVIECMVNHAANHGFEIPEPSK